eukprot:TRINITY_DN799_c0_g6_i1.p1 TRINITY_DN799_c0_g6~~TRINITY_DN799_c0_g6_i1.p1  ORF type:complete len:748 (+),score=339.17 TRINITY_DN799_c0_g6_i1:160-2403(+)
MMHGHGRDGVRSSTQRQFHVPPYPQMQGMLCPHQAEEKLRILEDAFQHIFSEKEGRPSYQAMYNEVYQLMKYKYEEVLYTRIERSLEDHAGLMHTRCMEVDDVAFLELLIHTAEKYMKAVKMVSDISLYMENNCIEERPKVNELGAAKFGGLVLKQPDVKDRVKRLTTQIVQQERSGEKPPSRQLLKELTAMMLGLKGDVYVPCLEQPFLEASTTYYRNEATALFHSSTSPAYLAHVFRRLDQESDRVERCFAADSNSTLKEIQRVVKETMLVPYAARILEKEHSGVAALLSAWRLPDLALMYQALHLIQHTEPMLERVKSFLVEEVSRFMQDQEASKSPVALVDEMLMYREKYDVFLDESCSSLRGSTEKRRDHTFEKEIQVAFVSLVNKNDRFAEYLSLAIDNKIRKKGVTEEECDVYFHRVLVLFQYLKDKDVFEEYYKRHLAKRLLTKTNPELETAFVSKLKAESGHQFTAKMEGMFNDMAVSLETTETFKAQQQGSACELSVHVLTTGFWPFSNPTSEILLPPRVDELRKRFDSYYLNMHTGRRLTWMTTMGSADVRYTIKGRKFEMNVSTPQMAVLVLFNTADKLTLGEIEEATKLPPLELKKQILGLAMKNKVYDRILEKSCEQSKDMCPDTVMSINPDFTSRHVKFKVASVVPRESDEQAKDTRSKVDDTRRWQLDAMIVRIMKSRKVIEHRQLVTEVINLSSAFRPTPDDIKKRIEDLIGREYMERCAESRSKYTYLA